LSASSPEPRNHQLRLKNSQSDTLLQLLGFGNTLEADVYQSHGGVQPIWMEQEIASYHDPRERRVKAFLLRHSINQKVQQWVAEYPIRHGLVRRIVAISDMVKEHMARHYGLPEDVFQVITGDGSSVGYRFVTNELVRKVCFTGSNAAGRTIMAGCADQVKRVTLELGGKSPTIIADDYDLKEAAARILYTKFINAGQTCVAPDYLFARDVQCKR